MHSIRIHAAASVVSVFLATTALAQTPASSAFTYQGRLKSSGAAVNGLADVQFTLMDSLSAGNVVAGPVEVDGVTVSAGLFTATVDFGPAAFDGNARWLQVAVRVPAGSGSFTPLTPRQALTATPFAAFALNARNGHALDAADGNPPNALFVDNNGQVGIGTTSPATLLHLANPSNPTIRVQDTSGGGKTFHLGIDSADDSFRIAETGVADRIVIGSNGNVGVGTASPTIKLTVDGGTDVSPTGGGYLQLGAANGINIGIDNNEIMARNNGQASDLFLNHEGGNLLILGASSSGNVGIGTTSPGARLHVEGSVRADNGEFQSWGPVVLHPDVDNTGDGIVKFVNSTGSETMRVDTNGNVGIGTSTPNRPLTVNGLVGIDNSAGQEKIVSIPDGGGTGSPAWAMFNVNGNQFVSATSVTGLPSNGAIAVGDDTSFEKAFMYVNSSGQGVVQANVKNFCEPNPADPATDLVYACIEGPEAAMYVRGTATLVNGSATVALPDHFAALAADDGLTVQVTPLSADSEGLAVVSESKTEFSVRELHHGQGNYEFHWRAEAVRKGYENYRVVRPWDEVMPAGTDRTKAWQQRMERLDSKR